MKNATLVFIGLILASVLATGLLWAESGGKLDLAPLCWLEAILLPISGIGYWIHLTEMKIAFEMQEGGRQDDAQAVR
jgi:hypothetical protein